MVRRIDESQDAPQPFEKQPKVDETQKHAEIEAHKAALEKAQHLAKTLAHHHLKKAHRKEKKEGEAEVKKNKKGEKREGYKEVVHAGESEKEPQQQTKQEMQLDLSKPLDIAPKANSPASMTLNYALSLLKQSGKLSASKLASLQQSIEETDLSDPAALNALSLQIQEAGNQLPDGINKLLLTQSCQQLQLEPKSLSLGDYDQTTYVSNMVEPMVSLETEQLLQLAQLLKEYDPQDQKDIDSILKMLKGIQSRLPNVTILDAHLLSSISGRMNEMASNLPNKTDKEVFWSTEAKMFGALQQMASTASQGNNTIYSALSDLKGEMEKFQNGSADESDLQKLAADLEILMQNGQQMNKDESKSFQTLLGELNTMKGGAPRADYGPGTLGQTLAVLIQNDYLSQYLQQDDGKTKSLNGFKSFLHDQFSALGIENSAHWQPLVQLLDNPTLSIKTADNPDPYYPIASYDPNASSPFSLNQDGVNTLLSNFMLMPLQPPTGMSWEDLLSTMTKLSSIYDPEENGFNAIDKLANQFADAQKAASSMSQENESLANEMIQIILGSYMPQANEALSKIANALEFNNNSADMLNQILDKISDFSNAMTNYGFGALLHGGSGGNIFDGTPAEAKALLQKEKDSCGRDLNSLTETRKQITQDIQKLQNDHEYDNNPKLLQAKNALIDKLNGYLKQIGDPSATPPTGAIGQLMSLQKTLNGIQIAAVPNQPDEFKITSNDPQAVAHILAQEDAVQNGVTVNNQTTGGLINIANMIKGDQQNYSNQSQSQQMELQLTMTEVQQAWTIVATVMTTLNQTYLSLAQSIYK